RSSTRRVIGAPKRISAWRTSSPSMSARTPSRSKPTRSGTTLESVGQRGAVFQALISTRLNLRLTAHLVHVEPEAQFLAQMIADAAADRVDAVGAIRDVGGHAGAVPVG